MDDAKLAVRRRLFEDFGLYAEHALKVRTKPDEKGISRIAPFILNRAQKRILDAINQQMERRGFVRMILVKGRQMGSSTFVEGWMYWWISQRPAQRALVVAHDGPATSTVFEMTRRFHDNCPAPLRPHTQYSGKRELSFDILDSSYRIATAGGDGIVRGDMINVAHLSEFAWWPTSSAKANFSGLMDAVPNTAGTAVFIESTANSYNLFWEQAEASKKDDSLFETVFLPFYWDDGYKMPVPDHFERSPDEQRLMDLYEADGLTDGHLVFRRGKISDKGEELFQQEFPFSADEAFLTSGRPVFPPAQVQEMLKAAREPIATKALMPNADGSWGWEDSRHGELLCFLPHDPHETYYIGADVGGGVRKDFSVAQVFDSKRRQAAMWRSDRCDPDHFGTVLANLGRFYGDAEVICERNNHGILTCRVLTKDEEYPNYYTETVLDKVSDTETTHVGFFTSERSKPLVIGKLRANLRDRAVEVYDRTTLLEMQAYVLTEKGKMEADKGMHDDCVMSLAMCDHINQGAWAPIENQDSWYVVQP